MVKVNHALALLVALGLCTACAADTSVMPVNSSENRMSDICIKLNPKISMPEFTYILEEGFLRHGITSKSKKTITSDCEYSLVYSAEIEKPDTKPVLNEVHLAIYRGTQLIGYADRDPPKGMLHGGGIELTRWDSTRAKIDPMLDDLLEGFSPVALTTPTSSMAIEPPLSTPTAPPMPTAVTTPTPPPAPAEKMPPLNTPNTPMPITP